jgi:DNA-binding FadR family transcriptional regulator
VESRAKTGTRVRAPESWHYFDPDVLRWQLSGEDTDTYLAKLFALRMALEPSAAALAAEAATAAAKSQLRAAREAMACAESNEAYITADIAFHVTIYTATGNQFFWSVAQMFEVALRTSLTITAPGHHRPRALAEYGAVMEAISASDATAARAASAILTQDSADDILRIQCRDKPSGQESVYLSVTSWHL